MIRNKITILLATLLFVFSCMKKERSEPIENQTKFEIIEALNQGDSDRALSLALKGQRENPNDFEYYYFEAQAYSQKANVDVYSLFPLMKMEIFDVAVTEWKKQEEFEKRQKSRLQSNLLGEAEAADTEDLDELERKIHNTPFEDFPIEISELEPFSYKLYVTEKEYPYCTYYLYIDSPLFVYDEPIRQTIDIYKDTPESSCESEENQRKIQEQVDRILENANWNAKSNAISMIERKKELVKERTYEQRYAKAFFALFDSIPILREAPTLTFENAENAILALKKLEVILHQSNIPDRLKNNTTHQMRLLSSYLIIGSYKNTTNLDGVSEVSDLICLIEPKPAISHYRYFLYGARFFMKSMKDSDLAKKNQENYIEYSQTINDAPEELTEDQIEDFEDDIQKFKNSRGC